MDGYFDPQFAFWSFLPPMLRWWKWL